ncbi:MAG: 5'-deoxynucleotidase [Lachnospiraceae bacterium]|nr:5'-deoxynucleotidase [Lachnospiraceae bacterium]
MENYSFFAMLSRMKYINRWGLMRNTITENISEHSLEVSIIAHALAVINNIYFGGTINPDKVAVYAVFHDAPEIITGDLPTPVKYFAPEIREAYKTVEDTAIDKLLDSLPIELRPVYGRILREENQEPEYRRIVKAADKISAFIKCVEEKRMGNRDFEQAEQATLLAVRELHLQEADYFMEHFMDSYSLTLDEQT